MYLNMKYTSNSSWSGSSSAAAHTLPLEWWFSIDVQAYWSETRKWYRRKKGRRRQGEKVSDRWMEGRRGRVCTIQLAVEDTDNDANEDLCWSQSFSHSKSLFQCKIKAFYFKNTLLSLKTTPAPHMGFNPSVDGNSAKNWCESENLHTEALCWHWAICLSHTCTQTYRHSSWL